MRQTTEVVKGAQIAKFPTVICIHTPCSGFGLVEGLPVGTDHKDRGLSHMTGRDRNRKGPEVT